MSLMKKFASVLLAGVLVLSAAGCSREPGPVEKSNFLLDTYVTIRLYDGSDPALIDQAFDEITRL